MKLKDLSKLRKLFIPIILTLVLVTIGIISTRGANASGVLREAGFKEIYLPLLEDNGLTIIPGTGSDEGEMVLIKAEVLSLASAAEGDKSMSEAFLFVKNQGQIGEDFVVCFMPQALSEVFSTALTNKYTIQVWGMEISSPEGYSSMTSKGFIVFAARVLRDDVPASFSNLGIFFDNDL